MAYIGSSPTKVVSRQSANIFTYTATANQTAFTGADANGNTLACSPSDLMVHMNGIKLEESDYTATTTTVTLGSGAAVGDEVTITAFLTFESADHYTKSAADTRYVNASGDTMSGDLTIDTNTFHVDVADNRVGIGTTTPYKALTISGAIGGTKADILDIQSSTAGGGTQPMVRFGTEAANSNTLGRIGFIDIPAYGGGFVVETNSTGGATHSTTEKFRVDKDGRVTMPNQPSFFVQGNFGWYDTGSGYSEINPWYTSVSSNSSCFHNDGSHFNLSNGRFTAPVAGRYQFNVSVYVNNTGEVAHGGRLYVNGSVLGDTLLYYRDTDTSYPDNTMSASYVLKLSVNDYVSYYHTEDIYGYHSHFSGYLIG